LRSIIYPLLSYLVKYNRNYDFFDIYILLNNRATTGVPINVAG